MSESFGPKPEAAATSERRGDLCRSQQDFLRLLVRHERQLEGFILALVPDWSAADDIAQETKLRLWEQFERFDAAQDFGAWARTIAYYQVLSYRNQSKRLRESPFTEQFLQTLAQDETNRRERVQLRERLLATCVDKLSEKSRSLLQLVYAGKETIRQIAKRLNRGESATYKAVQTIRLAIHKCVEDEIRREDLR